MMCFRGEKIKKYQPYLGGIEKCYLYKYYFDLQITFPCGKENKIINVTEPSTCNYHMTFETPYVCHKHAMLVYPTLDTDRQTEWGLLEGELARGEITRKV